MRQIIRRRDIVEDLLYYPGEPSPEGAWRVQPLAEFLAAAAGRAALAPTAAPEAAVLIGPTDEIEVLQAHLDQIALIVIDFPKPGEGRGFSQARVLRQRCRYRGELRARGALKRDQLFFLARCGFDSFDLDPSEDLRAALSAFDSFSVAYQAGYDEIVQPRQRPTQRLE